MTDPIKQWIADQTDKLAPYNGELDTSTARAMGVTDGLTKGIEIAEGFAEWINSHYLSNLPFDDRWYLIDRKDETMFTTSQLLELYLKTLEP